MIQIIADMREQRSGICRQLAQKEDVSITYRDLEAGDFILGPGIGLERKEAVDFVNSLIHDKRLFEQVRYLKASFTTPLLLIEGDLFGTRSAIHPNAIIGALSYLTVIEGISLIPVPNAKVSAQMLYTLAKHVQNGLGYEVALRAAKPKAPDTACQFLIEGLPGIGPSGAKRLLDAFETPRRIFQASEKELATVPGVGKKTAERICSVLDHCRSETGALDGVISSK